MFPCHRIRRRKNHLSKEEDSLPYYETDEYVIVGKLESDEVTNKSTSTSNSKNECKVKVKSDNYKKVIEEFQKRKLVREIEK